MLGRAVYARAVGHLLANNAYARFNKRLAVLITDNVGTMACFWLFCIISLLGLPASPVEAHVLARGPGSLRQPALWSWCRGVPKVHPAGPLARSRGGPEPPKQGGRRALCQDFRVRSTLSTFWIVVPPAASRRLCKPLEPLGAELQVLRGAGG